MKQDEHIKSEVDKTLHSLDNWQPLKPTPFFYTRMQAKMESRQSAGIWSQVFSLGVVKPAFAVALIAINIASLFVFLKQNNQSLSENEAVETFAEEYALNQSMEVYFYEPEE